VEEWLAANGGVSLVAGGVVLVVVALFASSADAVATAMVVMGAAMMIVGVLLPNLEGTLKIGPGGLEAVLRDVDRRAREEGLDEDDRALALGDAYRIIDEVVQAGRRTATRQSTDELTDLTSTASSGGSLQLHTSAGQAGLADRIVRQITDTEPVALETVPREAIEAVQRAADNPELEAREAQRRSGRGAPRWHLRMGDGRWWRVSNTVHGWGASPLNVGT
jgi:hypothetical protein